MQWSQDARLRIVFVAGNEPADQDPQFTLDSVIADAKQHRVLVNTIYCGAPTNGEAQKWLAFAQSAGGRYTAIDQTQVAAVATPMDAELTALSTKLNGTYVAYGAEGKVKAEQQAAQDQNASTMGAGVAASRAGAKASALYRAEEWDMVDARHAKPDVAKTAPAAALPEAMRNMSPAERDRYLDQKEKERTQIQKQIADATVRRDAYIREESKKRAAASGKALDEAMKDTIRTQGTANGLAF
jgi:hypothetical protein